MAVANYSYSQPNLAAVTINQPSLICNPGDCTMLQAIYPAIQQTTGYTVASIPFSPNFPFTGGTIIPATGDDYWSTTFISPFSFSFYGVNYNQILVGSNGVITFDNINQTPGGACAWSYTATIPNTSFPIRNAIYGVYQDTNISAPPVTNALVQNVNYYLLNTGTHAAPNRVFVANFNQLPQYQCNNSVGLQTSQIVIYETTNIIDINVSNRASCTTWNSGSGLIGLQNQAGTLATVPPGRNTGAWSATNEAWRFTPNGNVSSTLSWIKNGLFFSNANPVSVCPTESEQYMAVVNYSQFDGSVTTVSSSVTIDVAAPMTIENPVDLNTCTNGATGIFDLSVNTPIICGGSSPGDYQIYYFTSYADAINFANPISNTTSYSTSGETIYVGIQSNLTGCITTRNFNLILIPIPVAPTGDASQYFPEGATLSALVVNGTNIIWYATPTSSAVLPITTMLQNGVTYYATQTNSGGCESRMSSTRLAITATSALSNADWSSNHFKATPNPVKDMLNLSYDKNISNVVIYNVSGQEVITKSIDANQSQIDMSNLASGTYMVKVTADNQVKTIKVMKK